MKLLRNIFRERISLVFFMAFSILVGCVLIVAISSGEPIWALVISILYVVLVKSADYMLGYI